MDVETSSTISFSDHDKASIHAFVEKDIEDAQTIDMDIFVDAVFGISSETIKEQSLKIRELDWLEDPDIQTSLEGFCSANTEVGRSEPLASLINRIIELARGSLPGIPTTYPVDDICLLHHAPACVQTIPEHNPLGALRRPHLVLIRSTSASRPTRPSGAKTTVSGIKWSQNMASWELKVQYDLRSHLTALLEDRRPKKYELGAQANHPLDPLLKRRKREHADQFEDATQERDSTQRYFTASSICPRFYDPREMRKAAKFQAGSYALEMLACTHGTRLFCVNVIMDDDRIHLWYYDACGVVQTKDTISLIDDFEKAAALIVGIATCSPEQLGALPSSIAPPPSAPYPDSWPPENLQEHTLTLYHSSEQKHVPVKLGRPVFAQYSLSGRRTFVYNIEPSGAVSNRDSIVKLSYQVNTRQREQDLVAIAQKAGVEHLPQIHLSGDLFKMSDGVRRIFYERGGVDYEDRTLRTIVYSRYLPLVSLVSEHPECLREMTVQIINCLHDLKEKAGILHRDISVNNIMYELREGKPYFVLIDYDMAVVRPMEGEPGTPRPKYHEGTLAFMATDLLRNIAYPRQTPVRHYLRHDYESVFWTSAWCGAVFPEPTTDEEKKAKEHNIAVVKGWETNDFASIAHTKINIRRFPLRHFDITLIGKAACLRSWFLDWTKFWMGIDSAFVHAAHDRSAAKQHGLPPPPFDLETVDGLFTRDSILSALGVPITAGTGARRVEKAAAKQTSTVHARRKKNSAQTVAGAASKLTINTSAALAVTGPFAVNVTADDHQPLTEEVSETILRNTRHGYALRSHEPTAASIPKVPSRKVHTVMREVAHEGSEARRKMKSSILLKEAAVKAAAKRAAVKKAVTRKKGAFETTDKRATTNKTSVIAAVATTKAATTQKATTKKAKATMMKGNPDADNVLKDSLGNAAEVVVSQSAEANEGRRLRPRKRAQ